MLLHMHEQVHETNAAGFVTAVCFVAHVRPFWSKSQVITKRYPSCSWFHRCFLFHTLSILQICPSLHTMKGLPLAPNMYLPSSSEKTEAFVHSTPAKSRRPSRSAILQGCLVAVLTLAFYVLLKISNAHVTVNYHIEQPEESPQHRTIGLVSYSGRDRLAILDRYLKVRLTYTPSRTAP